MIPTLILLAIFSIQSPQLFAQVDFTEGCKQFGNPLRELELYSKQVVNGVSFNLWEQKMVMIYINHELPDFGLTTFPQVLQGIEDISDELYLKMIQNRNTAHKYLYVWSYPGENEYGVYLDISGNILAEIKDGELVVNGEWCDLIN